MNNTTGSDINFEWIRTPQQWDRLHQFAGSFDHKIKQNLHPVCAVVRDGHWRGYAQLFQGPLVFTAWHTNPKICRRRDVVECLKAMAGWGKVQHGGGFVGVPLNTDSFVPSIMDKLGFHRANTELYEILNNVPIVGENEWAAHLNQTQ